MLLIKTQHKISGSRSISRSKQTKTKKLYAAKRIKPRRSGIKNTCINKIIIHENDEGTEVSVRMAPHRRALKSELKVLRRRGLTGYRAP